MTPTMTDPKTHQTGGTHYLNLDEVRLELSLPVGFEGNKITEWSERIIIGNIPNNPAEFEIKENNPNATASVEVVVKTGTL